MRAMLGTVIGVGLALVLAGCAMWSDYSRPSLLGGDADIALLQNRSSKNVSKVTEGTSNTLGGGSTAAPVGGATVSLDPAQLKELATGIREAQAPVAVAQPRASVPVVTVPQPKYHMVVKGDTLWDISRQHGMSVSELKRMNGLKGSLIRPGQALRVR